MQMGFLSRLFGKKAAASEATTADLARSEKLTDRARNQQLAGREIDQTAAQQAATRGRMEAEMDAQRLRHTQPAVTQTPTCPHTTLTPQWDSVAAMGKEEQVTRYTCEGCRESFTAAEGRALRESEAARVQRELAT